MDAIDHSLIDCFSIMELEEPKQELDAWKVKSSMSVFLFQREEEESYKHKSLNATVAHRRRDEEHSKVGRQFLSKKEIMCAKP